MATINSGVKYVKYKGHNINIESVAGKIKRELLDNPTMDCSEVLENCKLPNDPKHRSRFHQVKGILKQGGPRKRKKNTTRKLPFGRVTKPATGRTLNGEQPLEMKLTLPKKGLVLKLSGEKGMLHTLTITEAGVAVRPAHSRNTDPNVLSWRVLETLTDTGLFNN